MCGRYVSPDTAAVEAQWRLGRSGGNPFQRRYNAAPTAEIPILRLEDGGLCLAPARWGLVPHWWKDARPPRFGHNARLEEAASKPMWRDALRRSRCLVPAIGWYEWRERDKQPFYFHRHDGRLAAIAGLMSCWKDPGSGAVLLSCALLTVQAQGALADVHERMPVALAPDAEEAWLRSGTVQPQTVAIALHPVRRLVNDARAEGAELIEPAPTLPA